MEVLHNEFYSKIKEITKLSKQVNKNNKQKIIEMMKSHIIEIEKLYNKKDDHWAVETADLIVLSLELLVTENKNIDNIFKKCIPRFYKKLGELQLYI